MAVADASVVIALAKIGKLDLLHNLFGAVVLTPAVHHEVVDQGILRGAPDVVTVQRAIGEGWLGLIALGEAEHNLVDRLSLATNLHAGETESLAVASLRRSVLLADERDARAVAQSLGVEVLGCAGVLFAAFRLEMLDLGSLEGAVLDLARVLWLSPEIVADILRRAREMGR